MKNYCEKHKDYNLSMIRFLAMSMVLFCHIFEQIGFSYKYSRTVGIIGNFLAVGVQIFLLLSGYLYGRKENLFDKDGSRIGFILRNFKKILVDYYIYVILIIIPIYYFKNPGTITISSAFSLLTCSKTFHGVNHLWFIPYILFCYLLTPLFYDLKNFLKNKSGNSTKKYILSVLVYMLLFEVFGYAFHSYFAANRINCFFAGFFLLPLLKEKVKGKKLSLFLIEGIGLLIVIVCWYFLRYDIKPEIDNLFIKKLVDYGICYCCFFQAFFLFYFYSLFGKALSKSKIVKKVLDFSDYFSFDIYISHMIFVKGTLCVLKVTPCYIINIFLALFLSIICGILLKYASNFFQNIINKRYIKCELKT